MESMEYSDTLEHRRKVLSNKSKSLKKQLGDQLEGIKTGLNKWGRTIAIAGGTMVATYIVIRLLMPSDKKQVNPAPATLEGNPYAVVPQKEESFILRAIKEEITLFLISFAKKKLIAFIEDLNKRKEIENSRPTHT